MGRRFAAGLALALLLVGCGAPQPSADLPGATPPKPHACDARAGSVTDVANEPDWRPYAAYTPWTTPDGCLLRIDVIADRPGPDHCGWQDARVIITGIPVGAPYSDVGTSATYVRDPQDVFGDPQTAAGFDPDAQLSADAVDTGYRQGATELWVDPTDGSAIFLVSPGVIERWPLDTEPSGCA